LATLFVDLSATTLPKNGELTGQLAKLKQAGKRMLAMLSKKRIEEKVFFD